MGGCAVGGCGGFSQSTKDRFVRNVQGSLLDNQELLESLNDAKAKAATITASLQESQLIQVGLLVSNMNSR